MNVHSFEENLRQELNNLGVTLLEIYTRRKCLCVDWRFEEYRPFTSCFSIDDNYLQNKTDEVLYKIVKSILYGIGHADNIVAEITLLKRSER